MRHQSDLEKRGSWEGEDKELTSATGRGNGLDASLWLRVQVKTVEAQDGPKTSTTETPLTIILKTT